MDEAVFHSFEFVLCIAERQTVKQTTVSRKCHALPLHLAVPLDTLTVASSVDVCLAAATKLCFDNTWPGMDFVHLSPKQQVLKVLAC